MNAPQRPAFSLVIAAFAAVYIIWGSTYLAIRYAVESLPPFLMAGCRYLVAGGILLAWARWKGAAWPRWAEWRGATVVGSLMLLGGNGGVTWAEQSIPSSIAALVVAVVPLWITLLEWRGGEGAVPSPSVFAGLGLGFAGVAWLVLGRGGSSGTALNVWGLAALLLSSVLWALGAIQSRRIAKPKSILLAIGMQMIGGGAVMFLFGLGVGEGSTFRLAQVTATSFWAWFYLMSAGALVGFTAYAWLLQVTSASKVATNAFVNPLIAVALGCTLGQEPFSMRLLLCTALIATGVLMIIRGGSTRRETMATSRTASLPGKQFAGSP